MEFLDKEGVKTLWNKVKSLVIEYGSSYLHLRGGGTISNSNTLRFPQTTTISGGSINLDSKATTAGSTATQQIILNYGTVLTLKNYSYNGTVHSYNLNVKKLIEDGYFTET